MSADRPQGAALRRGPRDRRKGRSFLKEQGLFFVGIDVIGDKLTEINVTSPTGVQEINALEGTKLEAVFIDRVEALVAAR